MRTCEQCPIKGTNYCHKVNPMAKKYTRSEKNTLQKQINQLQSAYKDTKDEKI